MKLTKDKLRQIILEEIELMEFTPGIKQATEKVPAPTEKPEPQAGLDTTLTGLVANAAHARLFEQFKARISSSGTLKLSDAGAAANISHLFKKMGVDANRFKAMRPYIEQNLGTVGDLGGSAKAGIRKPGL